MSDDPGILLELERVRVTFDSLVAVRDVCLQLRSGWLLGLVGPNGAGKTTLLRAIAGLQPLTCGLIRIMGMIAGAASRQALHYLGFTPDTVPAYDQLTVRQFLRFVGMGYNLPADQIDDRIDFWLEKVWLAEKAGQKIKSLSRGMRQRLGIARTLLPNPMIVLLDEPAAGLDPAGRVQLRQLLCDLREQGKTLIVSSHILADMPEYCSHIAMMAHGQILKFGTVGEVAGGSDGSRCRYRLVLVRPVAGAADLLRHIEGVSGVEADGRCILLEFHSDPQRAADLLACLVQQRLPVAGFSAVAPGLEEAYLRSGIRQVD